MIKLFLLGYLTCAVSLEAQDNHSYMNSFKTKKIIDVY